MCNDWQTGQDTYQRHHHRMSEVEIEICQTSIRKEHSWPFEKEKGVKQARLNNSSKTA